MLSTSTFWTRSIGDGNVNPSARTEGIAVTAEASDDATLFGSDDMAARHDQVEADYGDNRPDDE